MQQKALPRKLRLDKARKAEAFLSKYLATLSGLSFVGREKSRVAASWIRFSFEGPLKFTLNLEPFTHLKALGLSICSNPTPPPARICLVASPCRFGPYGSFSLGGLVFLGLHRPLRGPVPTRPGDSAISGKGFSSGSNPATHPWVHKGIPPPRLNFPVPYRAKPPLSPSRPRRAGLRVGLWQEILSD